MKVSFIGTIARPVEMSVAKTGSNVAKTSIVESTWSRKDEATQQYISDASFYNLEAYKDNALRLGKIPKGTVVYLEGDLTNVSYKAADGTNKSYLKIVMNNITPIKYVSYAELGVATVPQTAQVAAPVAPVATAPVNVQPIAVPVAPVVPVQQPVQQPVAAPVPPMPVVGVENPLNPAEGGITFDFSNVQ